MNQETATPLTGKTSPTLRERLAAQPMDPQITSIQPGGGIVIKLEQGWGHLRRWYLRTFRKGYVRRMESLRQGERNPCPHEVLDPRDLKFYRNQPGAWYWKREDDPFAGRDSLPFARVGLAELLVFELLFLGGAGGLTAWLLTGGVTGWLRIVGWLGVATCTVIALLIAWFFRNPHRAIPTGGNVVVSPADGVVVAIDEVEYDEFVDGPAVLVGIFLSIFNVHINRSPMAGTVTGLRYEKGKFLNALRPESARENEKLIVYLETDSTPTRRMVIKQITGAIARRIVCWLKPADRLTTGEQFGMIKLGSRTELILPREPGLQLKIKLGQAIRAGCDEIARYDSA